MTLRRALRLLERGKALSNVRFSDAQSSFYVWSSAFVIAFKNAKLSLELHGFCACFRSDAHACAAVYADRAQRTRPSASAAICVLGLVLLTATALSAFIPYLFAHTMDLIRRIMPTLSTLNQQCAVFLNALGLHPIGQTNLSEWLGTLISQGTGIIAKESMAFAARAGQFVFSFCHRVLSSMRKKTIGQAFAFAASHCAAGGFFICLFGLQKRVDELPVRRAENQLIRLSGNIRRAFRAWNQ